MDIAIQEIGLLVGYDIDGDIAITIQEIVFMGGYGSDGDIN